MPIYEYICKACARQFETLVQGDRPAQCPGCGGTELEQQYSSFAVGAERSQRRSKPASGGCGTCGDPRGPGSCAMN